MFRAFSLVLAVLLCTSGWSTAHAAGKLPFFRPHTGIFDGWGIKNWKLHRDRPIKFGKFELDEISLRDLGWPFAACASSEKCRNHFSSNSHKDAD
jgi:hypothetical protein